MDAHSILKEQLYKKLITEGTERIRMCLNELNEEQINFRANTNSNSIVNLIVHLDGNVRQWFLSAIAGRDDARNRVKEFDSDLVGSHEEMFTYLDRLKQDITDEMSSLDGLDLSSLKKVQCYTESNLAILIHVMEHFSYHVGQITYITKMLKDIDMGYYAGDDLTEVNK